MNAFVVCSMPFTGKYRQWRIRPTPTAFAELAGGEHACEQDDSRANRHHDQNPRKWDEPDGHSPLAHDRSHGIHATQENSCTFLRSLFFDWRKTFNSIML